METLLSLMQRDCFGVPLLFWTLLVVLVAFLVAAVVVIKVPVRFSRSSKGMKIETNLPKK